MADYSILSDLELVGLLKSDERSAFTEIYNRFRGLLFIYAFKLVKDEDEAADMVQEVFIYLWDKRGTIHFKTSLSSYLYSAIRYNFLNRIDHKKIREVYQASFDQFAEQGAFITDDHIRESELSRVVEKEIANLPPKMRVIFELSRSTPLSQKEIAEQLQISDKTVKKQIHNAVKILKVKLDTLFFLLLGFNCMVVVPAETLLGIFFKKN